MAVVDISEYRTMARDGQNAVIQTGIEPSIVNQQVAITADSVQSAAFFDTATRFIRVHADAPPFFVIHGTHDSLAYVEDTRHFVSALRKVSRQPVVYAELPGAQHAFDIFHSTRSAHAVEAVTRFVEGVRATHRAQRSPQLTDVASGA